MKPLAGFTSAQLLEELGRRLRDSQPVPTDWCEDCRHYVVNARAPDTYNPCHKGHAMEFYLEPDCPGPDPVAGFFRIPCLDRTPR